MLESLGIELSTLELIYFFIAGILSGVINTLVGSGSLITLPIFVFMCGLPADIANGTNRIGVFFQSAVGFYSFNRQSKVVYKGTWRLILACVLGATFGAWLASDINTQTMNYFIGGLMIAMLGILLVNPKRWIQETQATAQRNRSVVNLLIFGVIGVYAGFIQAGTGVFLIVALVLAAKYNLADTTGLKLLIILLLCIPALIIFALTGNLHFPLGILMAIAQSLGALVGVRFVVKVPHADKWMHRLLIIIIIVSAAKFLGAYDYLVSLF